VNAACLFGPRATASFSELARFGASVRDTDAPFIASTRLIGF
jgi:hypothetical protein